MSDFLFASTPQPAGRLRAILERRLAALPVDVGERSGAWGSVAWAQLPHESPMLREDGAAVRLLAGDPLPAREGAEPRYDGPFAELTLAGAGGRATTDLMAFIPVFVADDTPAGLVIGTHVDAVAEAAARLDDFDPVSGADFLAYGSLVYPHTLYDGVWQMAPAAEWRFERGRWTERRAYWTPHEENPYRTLREAAAALREALADDVARALAGVERAGMLLSAGEDSRVVLGAVPRGVPIDAFTFADWEGREVRIARRIARAYGADFTLGLRRFGHSLEQFEDVASFVGSQHQFIDVHAWGVHDALHLDRLPVVLGGFSSDVLLKAYYAPAKLRRSQPQKKHPRETDPVRRGKAGGVRSELIDAARERRERRRNELRETRPLSATEWMWIWPFSGRKPAAAYVGHRRLFRVHEPFMSDAIVRLAAAVPVEWKLDRRLFHAAMRPYLRPSWYVPHARNMFPYFGMFTSFALGAGLGLGRLVHDAARLRTRRHQGPWPDWWTVVRSEIFVERAERYPIETARARVLFDAESPAAIDATRRRWGPKRQMMYLQLAYLTQEGAGARPSAFAG
ncbi:MAG TPA: asparagine synthase-related protein [Longimicrobiales bacterium]